VLFPGTASRMSGRRSLYHQPESWVRPSCIGSAEVGDSTEPSLTESGVPSGSRSGVRHSDVSDIVPRTEWRTRSASPRHPCGLSHP
jgi:hypothetical protein